MVKSAMKKSFDAFRKILREQKLDAYFRKSCFGQYLDLPEDNNARFQMKIVCDLLKHRFMYENKDKMDEVRINYCGMPVCFGWREFSIVTVLKYYPPSSSQVIPTLTPKKIPHTPKKDKGKSSDSEDLLSIVGPRFKNKNLIEALKDCPSVACSDQPRVKDAIFLTLRSVQTLSNPKVVDVIKMKLFEATTIRRKIILEGGLVVVDDGSGNGAAVGANDAPLIVIKTKSHYDYDYTSCTNLFPDFSTSSECSACKCQDCKAKHDRVINVINALASCVKKMASKRGVILSKRISYSYTPLDIKTAKRRRKDTSKASSSSKKSKIAIPLSLSCTIVQCERITGEHHEPKKVDITVETTAEEHNITVDNPSTASKEEEKVEPVSSGERKNYPFEGFKISDEAPKKLTHLINDYSEWIVDGLLKHHADSIPDGLPWHLFDKVYIPINCGDEFYWVLAVVVLKKRRIRVYDSMSRMRYFGPSSEIQKLVKILPTYLDMSGFLDQKVHTDWLIIEAYRVKMGNLFDVQYVEGISQQTIGILDCGHFVVVYAEYLSDGLQVPNDGLDADYSAKDMLLFHENTKSESSEAMRKRH
ncbi:hypothetical protein CQW23_23706 [Capsicum baccatum]|uniref:Ubiquitin-like protease family profile domain-containing protein n=1 Tax=Capsicum baccatum TaxID=33114 RepID=A0A2G2VSR4_CAPBA|nr:hypothetical protein CQW23_23706 [Capsicum baccatum]